MSNPTLVVCTMIVRVIVLQHITEVPSAGSAERERPTASRACVPIHCITGLLYLDASIAVGGDQSSLVVSNGYSFHAPSPAAVHAAAGDGASSAWAEHGIPQYGVSHVQPISHTPHIPYTPYPIHPISRYPYSQLAQIPHIPGSQGIGVQMGYP